MPFAQVLHVEDAIQRIARRMPEMRVQDSLICRIVTILGRDITARLDQALQPAGLAELEFRTLLVIFARDGEASPGDLSASLAQSPANLTRISDVLVGRGFVTRAVSDQDRRRTLLRITPSGEALLRELLPQIASHTHTMFSGFTVEDKSRLVGDLKRLLAALDGLDVGAQAGGQPAGEGAAPPARTAVAS